MIPNIFISSTILDLHHLRDSIRDTISDLGYNPIMSDYGDIGYLPTDSAEESCYLAIKDCQLAVFIVAKRYGYISSNGLSVTHNEFKTARKNRIPVIFLVDEEILSYKKVYDATELKSKSSIIFPGMETPNKVFELVKEFSESEINNGLITYTTVSSAKINIKKQLAHIVGDLLRKQFDPIQNEIKDILTEITTLKHILLKKEKDVAKVFSVAFRELLDSENDDLRNMIEIMSGSLENGVQDMQKYNTLLDYFKAKEVKIEILPSDKVREKISLKTKDEAFELGISSTSYTTTDHAFNESYRSGNNSETIELKNEDPNDHTVIHSYGQKVFISNKAAYDFIEFLYAKIIRKINSIQIQN
jgi:hypothetical protein